MNMPNRASVHHFILWVFWASVSFGSWAGAICEIINRRAIRITVVNVLVFIVIGYVLLCFKDQNPLTAKTVKQR
jgi:quinol-cytochrome oxidoreductase complex cytochrome b subunit